MRKSIVAFLFLGLGAVFGMALALVAPEPDVHQTIEWLDNPRSLGSFSLETETGEFDNRSLKGRWTIVVFGFLNCPDICPTSLLQLATLADSLAEKSFGDKAAFVFVSVDPGRDSVAEVGQYVKYFHSSIRGATGKEEQLAQFASDLGIQFEVVPDGESYTVAHSITFSIIDPEGAFLGRFRPGFDTPELVENFISKLG